MPSSKGRFAAASTHWMMYSGARNPRDLLGDRGAERRRTARCCRVASATLSSRSRTRSSGRSSATALTANATAASAAQSVGEDQPSITSSTRPALECLGGADVATRRHHLERLRDTGEAGESLGAAAAGEQAEVHLGQAELRRRHGDPVVRARAPSRARRRGRCRGSRRSPGSATSSIAACTSWSPTACCAPPPNSVMSAPAMNVRPSQMIDDARRALGPGGGEPVEEPLTDVPAQCVHGRVVDDDHGDVADVGRDGLDAYGFGQLNRLGSHPASQPACSPPHRVGPGQR